MPLTQFLNAFGFQPGEVFACIGAGGKTTIAWQLMAEARGHGQPVIFTTTTHILEPILPPDTILVLSTAPDSQRMRRLTTSHSGLVLAGARLPDTLPYIDPNPVAPARPVKLAGLSPAQIDRLVEVLPSVIWLIEADGARGRGLKFPAAHEPAIPARSTTVAVVAHLDTIGHPLDAATVHRADQAAMFLGVRIGDPIVADHIVRLMSDPAAALKGIPDGARAVGVLTQRDDARLHPQAQHIASRLRAAGRYERVIIASPRAAQPVLEVFLA